MNHGLWLPAWLQCKPNRMSRGDLLVPGDFTIKTFGLQSVRLCGVF